MERYEDHAAIKHHVASSTYKDYVENTKDIVASKDVQVSVSFPLALVSSQRLTLNPVRFPAFVLRRYNEIDGASAKL